MLLSLVVWVGGIIFFSFALAPTVFSVLPTRHLAGLVVTRSLALLHWMGIVSGVVFVLTSMINARLTTGSVHPLSMRLVLVYVMLVLTIISQFALSPRMHALRNSMGEIDAVSPNDPARVRFNALHGWSTRLEGGVLILGFIVIYLTARRFT
jgi:hypothetical protein